MDEGKYRTKGCAAITPERAIDTVAGFPPCSFCSTEADWQVEIPRACIAHACDLHRAVLEVDADRAGYATIWRRIDGNAVALTAVILAALLLPGCGKSNDPFTPLFILAVAAGAFLLLAVIVLLTTRLGRALGCVETRDESEMDGVGR